MPLSNDAASRIREVVKGILENRLEKFPRNFRNNRNAPFHESFLEAFSRELSVVNVPMPYLVALASWMHGLNTSLGTGYEHIAHILSGGYKRKFTGADTLRITQSQAALINSIMVALKSGDRVPNPLEEEKELFSTTVLNGRLQRALGFTADVYIETSTEVKCIEIKSVRPNSGEGRGEKEKILHAKAALKRLHPRKTIRFFVGFPFDPTSDTPTGYDKTRFMDYLIEFKKFFAPEEVLIASELWDHLSGQSQTMEQVLRIVAETVNDFKNLL